jgi:SAM-dependent methyltransferase
LAQNVAALRARGYDCRGVDFAAQTVKAVKSLFPDLPVREGDLLALDEPDESYAAYISLGVVEHREAGPRPFLTEARRLLRPGGTLMLSVPCFNCLRRLKHRLGWFNSPPGPDMEFYQYAFSPAEIVGIVEDAGFVLERIHGYDAGKCLRDESPAAARLFASGPGAYLQSLLNQTPPASRYLGHMIMLVCRRP